MLRTIYLQFGAVIVAVLVAALVFGSRGAISAALGGAAYLIPSALFALRLHLVARRGGASHPVVFIGGELFKLAATVGLMALVASGYDEVHWGALLLGLIFALQANFFAFKVKT